MDDGRGLAIRHNGPAYGTVFVPRKMKSSDGTIFEDFLKEIIAKHHSEKTKLLGGF